MVYEVTQLLNALILGGKPIELF